MHAEAARLIAQAHKRARQVPAARDPQMRRAIVQRVLFDLRVALKQGKEDERTAGSN